MNDTPEPSGAWVVAVDGLTGPAPWVTEAIRMAAGQGQTPGRDDFELRA